MISTHVLDTSLGKPAAGIVVRLSTQSGESWKEIEKGITNSDGRIQFEKKLEPGTFQLLFEVDAYFHKNTTPSFYTQIPVVFKLEDEKRKYHVPLLLNPFGYSTYRGS